MASAPPSPPKLSPKVDSRPTTPTSLTLPRPLTGSSPPRGPTVEKLKELNTLLDNPKLLHKKAEEWLTSHDVDGSGSLAFAELKTVCDKMNAELGIPPVDDNTIRLGVK